MAKKFFYVCAGLFLLAFAYHLGARSAGAQVAGFPVASVQWDGSGLFASAVDGTGTLSVAPVYTNIAQAGRAATIPLPHGGTVIAVWGSSFSSGGVAEAFVVYSDGEIDRYLDPAIGSGGGWTVHGHLLTSSPTAAQSATWGQVKSTYRK